MSTKPEIDVKAPASLPARPDGISLHDLTVMLIRHYGHVQGKFELMIEYRLGFGSFGDGDLEKLPGMTLCVSRVGLQAAQEDASGPNVVDAGALPPLPRTVAVETQEKGKRGKPKGRP